MLLQRIFLIIKRIYVLDEYQTVFRGHGTDFIHGHELPFLRSKIHATAALFPCADTLPSFTDCGTSKLLGIIIRSCLLLGSQKDVCITVTYDGFIVILVHSLDLGKGLKHDCTGNVIFTHGRYFSRKLRYFSDVSKLVHHETYVVFQTEEFYIWIIRGWFRMLCFIV